VTLAWLAMCLVENEQVGCIIGYRAKGDGILENSTREDGHSKIEIPRSGGGGVEVELNSAHAQTALAA